MCVGGVHARSRSRLHPCMPEGGGCLGKKACRVLQFCTGSMWCLRESVTVLQWTNWVLAYLQRGGVDFSAVIYAAADVGAAEAAMFEFGGAN